MHSFLPFLENKTEIQKSGTLKGLILHVRTSFNRHNAAAFEIR